MFALVSHIPIKLILPPEFSEGYYIDDEMIHVTAFHPLLKTTTSKEIFRVKKFLELSNSRYMTNLGIRLTKLSFQNIKKVVNNISEKSIFCIQCNGRKAISSYFPLCDKCWTTHFQKTWGDGLSREDCMNIMVLILAIFENKSFPDNEDIPSRSELYTLIKNPPLSQKCVICNNCIKCSILSLALCNFRICMECVLNLPQNTLVVHTRNIYISDFLDKNPKFQHYALDRYNSILKRIYYMAWKFHMARALII